MGIFYFFPHSNVYKGVQEKIHNDSHQRDEILRRVALMTPSSDVLFRKMMSDAPEDETRKFTERLFRIVLNDDSIEIVKVLVQSSGN